jgi:hypothetical protein
MTDIEERLRDMLSAALPPKWREAIAEAADEIERLRRDRDVIRSQERNAAYEGDIAQLDAENERLRAENDELHAQNDGLLAVVKALGI